MEKNTFIIDIVGIYCYKKTTECSNGDIKGLKIYFFFHCYDFRYDRYLKNSLNINLSPLIVQSSSKKMQIIKL